MPKIKDWGVNPNTAAKAEAGARNTYDQAELGLPPRGVYPVRVKNLHVRKNKNDDWMISGVCETNAPPKSKKSKYNGYAMFFQENINETGAPYVNAILNALSGGSKKVRDSFWANGVKVDENKQRPKLMAIGPLKIEPDGMPATVTIKPGKDIKTDANVMLIDSWLLAKAEDKKAKDEDDDDDDDDTEDEDVEDDDADDSDDEDEDEDDEDDDDEDEDDDDEPPF